MSTARKDRVPWVDTVRGFSMVLVVFGHALIGVTTRFEPTQISQFCLLLIYCIHMPVLFALAGYLCQPLMDRPLHRFQRQVFARIIWPYFVWANILLAVHFLASDYANSTVATYRPWSVLWHPPAVMWFLYALFCAIALRRMMNKAPQWVICIVGVFCMVAPFISPLMPIHARFVGLFLITSTLSRMQMQKTRYSLVIVCATLSFGFLIWRSWIGSSADQLGYPAGTIEFLPALFVSPILVFSGAMKLRERFSRLTLWNLLDVIGRHSMAIFVLHIVFTAGLRVAFVEAGLDNIWVLSVLATTGGLIMPLGISILAARSQFGWLLGWRLG